ncbi:hypothetical protein OIDMADRAFT_143970 [Oidiodendron maius Zn]|uniref:Uncharacterized protein n=1 Tax=Oidiodendron maius (strain Zn) TaxID=913774 RepID=A0A0C3HK37_OIDMZ|nr:hypothetical protein OIDMADRAFT_143970 [Oidiodendron maius Zn]
MVGGYRLPSLSPERRQEPSPPTTTSRGNGIVLKLHLASPTVRFSPRMRDSFDHWREEKFGDERTSLPGSDFEGGEGAGRREEEEDILPVYQDRSCLEGSKAKPQPTVFAV